MGNYLYPTSSTVAPTYTVVKYDHLPCIQLIFCIDGNEVGRRQLPTKMLAKYPQWCLSLMLQDLPSTTDIISIDSKVISLITFDTVTQYLNFNNFWSLSLQTLHLLCQQGIITSVACTGLATIKDSEELILACRAAEFELDPNIKSIHCGYHSYKQLYNYLEHNPSIASYQIIKQSLEQGNVVITLVDAVPVAINNVPITGDMEARCKAAEEATDRQLDPWFIPITFQLEYLLPATSNVEKVTNDYVDLIINDDVAYIPTKVITEPVLAKVDYTLLSRPTYTLKHPVYKLKDRLFMRELYGTVRSIPLVITFSPTHMPIRTPDFIPTIPADHTFIIRHERGSTTKVYCGYVKL